MKVRLADFFSGNSILRDILKRFVKCRLAWFIAAALPVIVIIIAWQASSHEELPVMDASRYSEKLLQVSESIELSVQSEGGTIELFGWDKRQVKLEITKKISGSESKNDLEKKLESFNIQVAQKEGQISFRSEYKGSLKDSIKPWVALKVYMPVRTPKTSLQLGRGSIILNDDIRTDLNILTGTVHTDIGRLVGKLTLKGDGGNLEVHGGMLLSGSRVTLGSGNLYIKAEHDSNGDYVYDTGIGNVELLLPGSSRVNLLTVGMVEVNEFRSVGKGGQIRLVSQLGRIAIRSY